MTSKGVEVNTIGCGGLCLITDFKGEIMPGVAFQRPWHDGLRLGQQEVRRQLDATRCRPAWRSLKAPTIRRRRRSTGTMSARDMTGAMSKSRTVSESPGCRSSGDDDVLDHARRQGDADDAHHLHAAEVSPSPRRLHVSTENSAFQVLESLVSNRVKRHRSRTFLLEGVQPITRALAHGWTFDAVIHESGASLSDWAAEVIARAGAAIRYEMTPELLARLSGKTDTSELLAVVRMRDESFTRIPVHPGLLAVVMDRPGNPGNLGTLIRSCDALGASGLIVTGHAVDPYDPATLTASRGSIFALPVVQAASHAEVLQWVASVRERLGRCDLVGTDERADTDLAAHDFTAPTVLVVGNESTASAAPIAMPATRWSASR